MTGPLSGSVVVTTREGDPDGALAQALRAEGAEVLSWPTLAFLEPSDSGPLEEALARLDEFQWLAFTSPRAARAVASRYTWREGDGRVAAVGPSTAQALREGHWPVHVVGQGGGAEGLVRALDAEGALSGLDVLFFAGSLARPTLEEGLRARGSRVHRVEAYRTAVAPPDASKVRDDLARGLTAVLFASPSAVQGVAEAVDGELDAALEGVAAVAIGPTTAAALEEAGVRPCVATETSLDGLVSACVDVVNATRGVP